MLLCNIDERAQENIQAETTRMNSNVNKRRRARCWTEGGQGRRPPSF
jgi:hypothetical protein